MAITYRGIVIPFAKHSNNSQDKAQKIIAFPGVDGIEKMPMGRRGRRISVTGRVTDETEGFREQLREWEMDNDTGELNIHGISYPKVELLSFTESNFYGDAVTGFMCNEFSIEFFQLQTISD